MPELAEDINRARRSGEPIRIPGDQLVSGLFSRKEPSGEIRTDEADRWKPATLGQQARLESGDQEIKE